MAIDEHTLYRAKRFDRQAMHRLLEGVYEPVYRMAYGLSGRGDVAEGVIRFVMVQALKRLGNCRDSQAAERWFYHHTVLTSRRAAAHRPKAGQDTLVVPPASTPAYVAFVTALRGLPVQQREAFILHHGQGFDHRAIGVAMDCSTTAAAMHLKAAQTELASIAAADLPGFTQRLAEIYRSLTPDQELIGPRLLEYINRSLRPRRIKRWLMVMVIAMVLAGIWWAYRRWWPVF